MPHFLELIAGQLWSRVVFGAALAAFLAAPVRLRYTTLVRRPGLDLQGVAVYQRAGFWLAALSGFTGVFLPGLAVPVVGVSIALIAVSTLLVGGLRPRSAP